MPLPMSGIAGITDHSCLQLNGYCSAMMAFRVQSSMHDCLALTLGELHTILGVGFFHAMDKPFQYELILIY